MVLGCVQGSVKHSVKHSVNDSVNDSVKHCVQDHGEQLGCGGVRGFAWDCVLGYTSGYVKGCVRGAWFLCILSAQLPGVTPRRMEDETAVHEAAAP